MSSKLISNLMLMKSPKMKRQKTWKIRQQSVATNLSKLTHQKTNKTTKVNIIKYCRACRSWARNVKVTVILSRSIGPSLRKRLRLRTWFLVKARSWSSQSAQWVWSRPARSFSTTITTQIQWLIVSWLSISIQAWLASVLLNQVSQLWSG